MIIWYICSCAQQVLARVRVGGGGQPKQQSGMEVHVEDRIVFLSVTRVPSQNHAPRLHSSLLTFLPVRNSAVQFLLC